MCAYASLRETWRPAKRTLHEVPGMKYPGSQRDVLLCPACVRNGADPRRRAVCLWETSI